MKNTIYQLVEPEIIEPKEVEVEANEGFVLVKPTHLSICHADARYYWGERAKEVLRQKLPMALIHEGIGDVVADPSGEFKPGDLVAMIPNTPEESDAIIGENYLRTSRFRASGFDGYMQSYVAMRKDRLVALPEDIDRDVLAFLEICTVAYHIIDRFDKIADGRRDVIGVWGEGNMGFITSLFLKYRFPQSKILIFGKSKKKMSEFTFADGMYSINEIPEDVYVDHAFECVGGVKSGTAVNQMINEVIRPEGTIALSGVSEEYVPLHTRMILEKGLRFYGSSRSGREDFINTVEFYKTHPEVPALLSKSIGEVVEVHSVDNIHQAFELDMENRRRKTIIHWHL